MTLDSDRLRLEWGPLRSLPPLLPMSPKAHLKELLLPILEFHGRHIVICGRDRPNSSTEEIPNSDRDFLCARQINAPSPQELVEMLSLLPQDELRGLVTKQLFPLSIFTAQ